MVSLGRILLAVIIIGSCLLLPVNASEAADKPKWRDLHPKIYRVSKQIRLVCAFCSPVVSVASNVVTVVAVIVR